ncbi:MAG: DUF302 domain-containing protein [Pseudomonadota bacterium]
MKSILLAGAIVISGALVASAAELVTKPSANSVAETIDKLAAAVENAGAKVFARVDHAAGAASIDAELRPTQMLMFGNPKLGTPAMQASQTMGLDLPIRVVAWEDEGGKVFVAYHDPADLAALHGVPADHPVIGKMQGALNKLTGFATGE